MSSKQGNIGVTSENIFPIIKKFLYSDHEIFLRELVSNAVDATQKLKTLSSVGEFKGVLGENLVALLTKLIQLMVGVGHILFLLRRDLIFFLFALSLT